MQKEEGLFLAAEKWLLTCREEPPFRLLWSKTERMLIWTMNILK